METRGSRGGGRVGEGFQSLREEATLSKGVPLPREGLTATDDDWPAVARNLHRARATWGRLARILGREGADPKVSRMFYIAVTHKVLLFGAESWVLTGKMEEALDAFQGIGNL